MKTNNAAAGLYIHIPFCLKKCQYCGFLSQGGGDGDVRKKYVENLIKEIRLYKGRNIQIDTLFLGGGTPSILSEEQIAAILTAARFTFVQKGQVERTMEANPKTLTQNKLETYKALGINRLSIGSQALQEEMLIALGRSHTVQDVLDTYGMAREAGFDNINLDLMFGIPGQTQLLWEESLEKVISLRPEHLSLYSLQLEEGTPYYDQYKAGSLSLPSDEEERRMYRTALTMLQAAGYEHYEISNWALPGYACRHNLKYWSYDQYYGVGLGAHSFRYSHGRFSNVKDLAHYDQEIQSGNLPIDLQTYQAGTLREAMGEYVFTGLRKRSGIDTADFAATFDRDFFQVYRQNREQIQQYQREGYLRLDGTKLALTEAGIDCSNTILAEFV